MNKHLQELEKYRKAYPDISFIANIKSGKEADVVKVHSQGKDYALKIYKNRSILSSRNEYIAGKWIREKSLRKSVAKKNKVGKELLERLWTKREFYMLKKLKSNRAIVPEVYDFRDKSILMEYLGDEKSFAPRLKDIELSPSEYEFVFEEILKSIKVFLENGIVHGDLSEYNILWWKNQPYIIDFPQSIDIRTNPNAKEVLERDINNICNYFGKTVDIEKYKDLIVSLRVI